MAHSTPSASTSSQEDLGSECGQSEELFTEEEDAPEIKDALSIVVDASNRERWSDIVLEARKHMRCHPKHPGRVRDGGRVCILVESSSDDEDENKLPPCPAPEPEPEPEIEPAKPTFTLFNQLPRELRDSILLGAINPITVTGWIKIDLEWRAGPQAHFSRRRIRSWAAIPLYAVSRETRSLATTAFGAPDPRTFPFSPARDVVELAWDGSMLPTTWRKVGDYRLAGPVITGPWCGEGGDGNNLNDNDNNNNIDEEWAMPEGLCERVRTVLVDGRYARFDYGLRDGVKRPWGLVFGLLKGFFAGVRVLGVRLWDLDDEGFEGSFDAAAGEALYRVDQMDFFDGLEEVCWFETEAEGRGGGGVAFPRLRVLKVLPEIPRRGRRRHEFRFRKVRGSHFLVFRKGDTPTAGP
ncbi:hypothetical protein CORC01_12192 [Colletotrichum orchidophilum]|uniref:2EXR domain-containing protein n=1 Tax=Colletotrichum orchidophilum TaxID=1209926 RepID=A0A1G4ATI7_9PEZI|nr:uncharacterized protein CORC01_12192 [Colletotrichum orchidophilum]OHE92474.1 hypothetical protein CORC01_12192 [Colletotrichum orchidophilum]